MNTPETVRGTDIVTVTNRNLHTPYVLLKLSFRMTLSDLAKYSMTGSTRSLSATAELLVVVCSQVIVELQKLVLK